MNVSDQSAGQSASLGKTGWCHIRERSRSNILATPLGRCFHVDTVKCDILAGTLWVAIQAARTTDIFKCQVAKHDVTNLGARCCCALAAALVPRLDFDSPTWLSGDVEDVVYPSNISHVATILHPRLYMCSLAPFTTRLCHDIPNVQHILHTTTHTAADRDAHACA